MAKKPKFSKNHNKIDNSMVEEIVEQEIEFVCPKRGKIKQKVKIKKLKPAQNNSKQFISDNDELSKIESSETSEDITEE